MLPAYSPGPMPSNVLSGMAAPTPAQVALLERALRAGAAGCAIPADATTRELLAISAAQACGWVEIVIAERGPRIVATAAGAAVSRWFLRPAPLASSTARGARL